MPALCKGFVALIGGWPDVHGNGQHAPLDCIDAASISVLVWSARPSERWYGGEAGVKKPQFGLVGRASETTFHVAKEGPPHCQ